MSDLKSRRQFLSLGGMLAGAAVGCASAGVALADVCSLTPAQEEGPFYPLTKITDNSINDLSVIEGHSRHAKGETIYITGTVTDDECRPVKGALVEIWQAATSGRYNHPSDTSGLELDPDFQGWGEFVTGDDGRYAFKTIVPGHYPVDADWTRPPHVHYKVTRRGYRELITQMYFTPTSFTGERARLVEQLNAADQILNEVTDKRSVIVPFAAAGALSNLGPLLAYRQQGSEVQLVRVGDLIAGTGEKLGRFDLTLLSQR